MRKIKGKDILIFREEKKEEGYKSVALSTSCELSILTDAIPVLDDKNWRWRHYIAGKSSWQVTTTAQMAAGTADPLDLLHKTVKIMFGTAIDNTAPVAPGSRKPDGYIRRYGEAIVTEIAESGEVEGIATYSMTLMGTGELKHDAKPEPHGSTWINPEEYENTDNWIN